MLAYWPKEFAALNIYNVSHKGGFVFKIGTCGIKFFDILEKSKKLLDESLLFYRSQFASSFNYGGLKVGGRVIITISKFFKATKGAWWMPWL